MLKAAAGGIREIIAAQTKALARRRG